MRVYDMAEFNVDKTLTSYPRDHDQYIHKPQLVSSHRRHTLKDGKECIAREINIHIVTNVALSTI